MKKHSILMVLVLLITLTCCKTEIKTNPEIDETVYQMWDDFIKSYPEYRKDERPESWYFHNNRGDANRLADLVSDGKKKASSGLYIWYKEANADLPKIATKHIITDFDGKAKAIIEIRNVDTIPFNQISKEYAKLDMGTKIDPLKKWKKAHWDFFRSVLEQDGKTPTEDMLVVCESFETIWPEKH